MLRIALATDIPSIQRVRHSVRENRLVSGTISDEEVREALEDSGRGWVVEVDGEVVGFAIGKHVNANIWALFVDPDYEGRGFGRALHDAMVEWLWSQGLTRLRLSTDPGTRAQSFYEAAGWRRGEALDNGEVCYELERRSVEVEDCRKTAEVDRRLTPKSGFLSRFFRGKASDFRATLILLTLVVLLLYIASSQQRHTAEVGRWIKRHREAWTDLVAEHPNLSTVKFQSYTAYDGSLLVVCLKLDAEEEAVVRRFVQEHSPSRPVVFIGPSNAHE